VLSIQDLNLQSGKRAFENGSLRLAAGKPTSG